MKTARSRLRTILAGAAVCVLAPLANANPKTSLESFDFRKEPAKADWRYFLKAPEISRQKLWGYHVGQGHQLRDWSWGWRLGWVRACSDSQEEYCGQIMAQALGDKAMVVRAEAATRLGRRFDGSQDAKVTGLLVKAYDNKGNVRNGKPLFVQNRILFALHQIGGKDALAVGEKLAASHPQTREYWQRLARAENLE